MTQAGFFVGIDVSKDRLDVFLTTGESFSVPNDAQGLAELARRADGALGVGLEASGGYEMPALRLLSQAGLTLYRLDPTQVRAFARSRGQRAKTDAIDARMIALCLGGTHAELRPWEERAGMGRLAELQGLRRQLVGQKAALAGKTDRAADPFVRTLMAEQALHLRRLIARLDAEIAAAVAADPELERKAAQLRSAPGVGPVLAATLIASLPELGRIDSRKIAALVGVAPYDRQSGRRSRPGRCAAGRRQIRNVLYMAVLAAIRSGKKPFASTYQRLRAAGKPQKLAITAVMRKMIVILNAMLRDGNAFAT